MHIQDGPDAGKPMPPNTLEEFNKELNRDEMQKLKQLERAAAREDKLRVSQTVQANRETKPDARQWFEIRKLAGDLDGLHVPGMSGR